MDSRALARLIDDVGAYKQDSVLIVRNGKIVADAYYAPYVAGVRHDLRSVTKSFLSTAVGILVQQGKLESVDRPVLDFFPDPDRCEYSTSARSRSRFNICSTWHPA
jgi:CubicO group peptidase (beta-lactamase class C family)